MKSNKAVVKVMSPKSGEPALAPLVKEILSRLGEDPDRQGLARTPERVEQALKFLTSGYGADISRIVNGAIYDVKYDEMVVVREDRKSVV